MAFLNPCNIVQCYCKIIHARSPSLSHTACIDGEWVVSAFHFTRNRRVSFAYMYLCRPSRWVIECSDLNTDLRLSTTVSFPGLHCNTALIMLMYHFPVCPEIGTFWQWSEDYVRTGHVSGGHLQGSGGRSTWPGTCTSYRNSALLGYCLMLIELFIWVSDYQIKSLFNLTSGKPVFWIIWI